jgi:hypothetical protein
MRDWHLWEACDGALRPLLPGVPLTAGCACPGSGRRTVDGIGYLRPEVALLYKARLDRKKDRADLAAARLDPPGRAWLAETLKGLGQHEWARLTR